jgi:hypothetical protein
MDLPSSSSIKITYPLRRRREQFALDATESERFLGNATGSNSTESNATVSNATGRNSGIWTDNWPVNWTGTWKGDRSKATNGSRDPQPSRPLLNGYPYSYACPTNETTKGVQLIYDYEVVFRGTSPTSPEFWAKDLYALEWGLLYMVADRVGLRNCNYSRQSDLNFPSRRHLKADYLPPRIVSLMSTRQDSPDLSARKYIYSHLPLE